MDEIEDKRSQRLRALGGFPQMSLSQRARLLDEDCALLFDAAQSGDRLSVEALLARGVDPNAMELSGLSALHWATGPGILSALLRAGADPDIATHAQSPLMWTIAQLEHAMRPAASKDEWNGLMIKGLLEKIGALLDAGADPGRKFAEGSAMDKARSCSLARDAFFSLLAQREADAIGLVAAEGSPAKARSAL